jgi:hypothetical protein
LKILIKTNDPVLISYATSLLTDAGVEHFVFDANMSVMEGSIGILPRRLAVIDGDAVRARRVLAEAGLETEHPERDG